MADLQSALFARLTTDPELAKAVATRVYWTAVPQGAAMPYIRLQTVSDPRPQSLGGYTGSRSPRIQVDVFSRKYSEARALSERIIALMAQPDTVAGVRFGRAAAKGPRDLGEDVSGTFVHRLVTDLMAEHSIA